ncbi:MAG TPA: glycoside hydrolase family 31 protein [Candidatus Fusicatenibacter intestinigallinarum]|uniref:Glycoside hydrolase family 31 protein n=1 Tax=Candidatus Fusicatenibacter intestinigallinarum TaxID=2838598 RepID=A0A9D2SLT5_9FIRM|nr:glycoside hydrolase family 31 protein [Candidatus Fusicatenibacter intestinigallinarum]
MKEYLKIDAHPEACPENVVQGENFRITVLTKSLVRLEYSPDGEFTDAPTQTVLNRDFPQVSFELRDMSDELEIRTEYFQLNYDKKEFTSHGLSCYALGMPGGNRTAWRYGEKSENLKGTARTLDNVDGACELEDGILSMWCGCVALDDSRTLTIREDGWVEPRKKGIQDLYLFVYGHRFLEALKDFYHLCGETPMLPRFALGNWWSRYYKYTEESYLKLMNQFDKEQIPFTVAVIDMDWHLVDIDPKYGTGWTGYTWNREMFPDPERFLKKLHDRGMKTTLNLHPADGIRAFEDCYPQMAEAMGMDPEKGEPVNFDIANPVFLEAYFDKALHPMEEEGVDFWWIDWQQGTNSRIEGLDPLWMLNHYHFLDSGRDGKRPMTFSRYAGPGSHRYPVGFSGDTLITWESLDFQPYFTSTASNIGYGWWSHDIGGHMLGYKNDEMEARWYQFGVFSPVNRLHSSSSEFNGKEPWRFKKEVHDTMCDFLRLRHRLMPYLYTMNHRAWEKGEPICQPMYYQYPENFTAYGQKNEYFFGSELVAAPVTTPRIRGLNVACTKVWLPEGMWFDFFTDTVYRGGRNLNMYRTIDEIPVLAKAGAIVPMTERIQATEAESNPDELTIRVYPGADNTFVLYEDDNVSEDYRKGICACTEMKLDWTEKTFTVSPVRGELSLLPVRRTWKIELHKTTAAGAEVLVNGEKQENCCSRCGTTLTVTLEHLRPEDRVEICLPKETEIAENPVQKQIFDFLNQAEIGFIDKEKIYRAAERSLKAPEFLISELQSMEIDQDLCGAVLEFAGAYLK